MLFYATGNPEAAFQMGIIFGYLLLIAIGYLIARKIIFKIADYFSKRKEEKKLFKEEQRKAKR